MITGIHEGVTEDDLAAALATGGYHLDSSVELIRRYSYTCAYVTVVSNDEAVDLILNSDSIQVGEPPCRIMVKVARPRDSPKPNYPSDEVIADRDHLLMKTHGVAHGMTDTQLQQVVQSIQGMQEVQVAGIIERLTGTISGLPLEFQHAMDRRLAAIDSAVAAAHLTARESKAEVASLKLSLDRHSLAQDSRLASMEAALESVMVQMSLLVTTLGADCEWGMDEACMTPALSADPTFVYPVDPLVRVVPAGAVPSDGRNITQDVERAPPARGGISVTVLGNRSNSQDQGNVTQSTDMAPKVASPNPFAALGAGSMDTDLPSSKRGLNESLPHSHPSGSNQENETEGPSRKKFIITLPETRHPDVPTSGSLGTGTPSGSQDAPGSQSTTDSLTSVAEEGEILPGLTAAGCGRIIAAWNGVCGNVHTYKLHNGDSADQLVRQAQLADRRLRDLIEAGDHPDHHEYSARRATELYAHALAANVEELRLLRDTRKENTKPVDCSDQVAQNECL